LAGIVESRLVERLRGMLDRAVEEGLFLNGQLVGAEEARRRGEKELLGLY
jgi:hypothetical protein